MKSIAFPPLLAALCLAPALALAQPPPDPATQAMRDHFASGVKAYDARRYQDALGEFQAAYQAKPAPAILRNVALTLKALGRNAEALDTLQQFVDDSGPGLKPEVRDAATSEMRDLAPLVATVHVRVVPRGGAQPVDGAQVSVDRIAVEAPRVARGLHLTPGVHVLHAHLDGAGDGEVRKEFAAGEDTETLELAPAMAKLHIVAQPEEADIRIDGASVRHGSWSGPLPAGKHHVVVSAPGFAPVDSEIALEPDEARELPISLNATGDAGGGAAAAGATAQQPPSGEAPPAVRLKPHKRNFVELGAGFQGESLTPAAGIGGSGKSVAMGGVGLFSAFGTELGRYFTIGGFGELLFDTAKYGVTSTASPQPTVNTSDFIAGPEMRFRTPTQPIRFFAALGPLLDVRWAAANQPTMSGATLTTSGAGAGLGLQAEAGLDASISPAYIHAGFYLVAHDISSVKDNTGARLFDQTGSVQAGLRAMIGLPF